MQFFFENSVFLCIFVKKSKNLTTYINEAFQLPTV